MIIQGRVSHLYTITLLYYGYYLPNIQPFGGNRKFHGIVFLKLVSINFLDKMQRERT